MTVFWWPRGLPIAMTDSPIISESELPSETGWTFVPFGSSNCSSARSYSFDTLSTLAE